MFSAFFGGGQTTEPESTTPTGDTASTQEKPLIVITGVSGYVGSSILKYCLDNLAEEYRVRGTVREPSDLDRLSPLYDFFGGEETLLNKAEIVHLDLQDAESVDKAITGATYVIHTANPVGLNEPTDANEMILPSVQGVTNVVKSAANHGVKRVVITSSVAAVETQPADVAQNGQTLDESFWSDLEAGQRVSAYA